MYQLGVSCTHVEFSNIHEPSKTTKTHLLFTSDPVKKEMFVLKVVDGCIVYPYARKYALVSISQG